MNWGEMHEHNWFIEIFETTRGIANVRRALRVSFGDVVKLVRA